MGAFSVSYACSKQNLDLVKLLLNNGATLKYKSKSGKTALDYALSQNNKPRTLELLKAAQEQKI